MAKEKRYFYVNSDYKINGINIITKNNSKQSSNEWLEIEEISEEMIEEFYDQRSNYKNHQFILVDNKLVKDENILLEEFEAPLNVEKIMKVLTRTMLVNKMTLPPELEEFAKDTSGEDIREFKHKETYFIGEIVKYKENKYMQKQAMYPANDVSHVPGGPGMTAIWEKLK